MTFFKKIFNSLRFWQILSLILLLMIASSVALYIYSRPSDDTFVIEDDFGGNLFPSAIVSTASTGTQVYIPSSRNYIGNAQSELAFRIRAPYNLCKIHVEVSSTPFFQKSVSDFVLPKKDVEYMVFPDILWNYEALKNNSQSVPVSVSISVSIGREDAVQKVKTYSVRSINECLIGYKDAQMNFYDTGIYFAAYVNEEHPMIDQLLREALNTRIVRRFVGLQNGELQVDKQIYALWFMLQKRNFTYSSVSNSILSSNVVFSQRVRTLDDALESSQINCVDGSVLFASLMRAINIEPVLIRIPGHMFVGYYSDKKKENLNFLETTMLGDVNLDDFFPEENLDSLSEGKSQTEMSRLTYNKAKEYATKKYKEFEDQIKGKGPNTLFLPISKETRAKIQSIGR